MESPRFSISQLESRHAPFYGQSEQEQRKKLSQIRSARILMAGCGAGSPPADYFARRNFATDEHGLVMLADPDVVDNSNLNRQAYAQEDVGKNKAHALATRMRGINPHIHTRVVSEGITLDNIASLVGNAHVVLDMIDIAKPDLMFALHLEAQAHKIPVVTGLDVGNASTITYVFDYRDPSAMTLRQFIGMPEGTTTQDIQSIPTFALASQFIIGPTEQQFTTKEAGFEYYNTFFDHEAGKLFLALPEESLAPLQQLVSGELSFVPQSGYAAGQLGVINAQVVESLLLNEPVRTVPDSIRLDTRQLIRP